MSSPAHTLVFLLTPLALLPRQTGIQEPASRSTTELRRIESAESTPAGILTAVGALAVSPTGVVYVGQNAESVIRVYDANGKVIHSLGRRGQGPGEFGGAIGRIGFLGDTIWARDNVGRRINFFSPDGRTLGSINSPRTRDGRCSMLTALLRTRLMLLACRYPASLGDSTVFIATDENGTEKQVLFRATEANVNLAINTGSGTTVTMLQPFAPRGDDAVSPGSARAVIAAPVPYWNGRPGQLRLILMGADGAVRTLDLTYSPKPLTTRDVDTLIAKRSQQLAASGAQQGYRQSTIESSMRDGLNRPTHFSELADILLGDDGSIWTSAPYDPSLWRVHGADGRMEFTVRVESGLRVMQVARDSFWGVRTNADGVPTIVHFRVNPR